MQRPLFVLTAMVACTAGVARAAAPPLPANLGVTSTNDSIVVVASDGRIISTTVACAGFRFAQFGEAGPKFSPDQHWILVDLLGPLEPGNVPRVHAIVDVRHGGFVIDRDFTRYLGIAASPKALSWASGRRAAIRYDDGSAAEIEQRRVRPFPAERCAPPR